MRPNAGQPLSVWLRCLTALALLAATGAARTQIADFQIVWVVVGEVATAAGDQPVQAGKHLFMASDLTNLSLKQVQVAKVEAEPVITAIHTGDRLCLTDLKILAWDGDRDLVKRAPLSVSVRQDHRDSLQLQRSSKNICMRPNAPGEYPIRFSSLLPAADGSTRGAQVFVRVENAAAPAAEDVGAAARAPG